MGPSDVEAGQPCCNNTHTSSGSTDSDDNIDDMVPIPLIAMPGEPIGIITIEDVIEELMQVCAPCGVGEGGEGGASPIKLPWEYCCALQTLNRPTKP